MTAPRVFSPLGPWPGPEALESRAWEGTAYPGDAVSVFQAIAPGKARTFLQAFPVAMVQEIAISHCFSLVRPRLEQPLVSCSLCLLVHSSN